MKHLSCLRAYSDVVFGIGRPAAFHGGVRSLLASRRIRPAVSLRGIRPPKCTSDNPCYVIENRGFLPILAAIAVSSIFVILAALFCFPGGCSARGCVVVVLVNVIAIFAIESWCLMRLIITGSSPRLGRDGSDWSELWCVVANTSKKPGTVGYATKTYRSVQKIAADLAGLIAASGPAVVDVDIEEETYGNTTVIRVISFEAVGLLSDYEMGAMGLKERLRPALGNGAPVQRVQAGAPVAVK